MTDKTETFTRRLGSLAECLATTYSAMRRCEQNNNDYAKVHADRLRRLIGLLDHGSGIDSTWEVDDGTSDGMLVLTNEYHLMDANGFYCGWVPFKVFVRPAWSGIDLDVEIDGSGIDNTVYSSDEDESDEAETWSDADGLDSLDDYLCERLYESLKNQVAVEYSGKGDTYVEHRMWQDAK